MLQKASYHMQYRAKILSENFMRFIRWQIIHIKCLVWFSLQNKGEFWMLPALKIVQPYKDINSIGLHFELTHISVVVKAGCNFKTRMPARNDRWIGH